MRKRLTFANVTSMLALFFALSGASYAAVVLPSGSVGPRQLRQNAVTASKLAPHAVQSRSLAPGAVTSGSLARGAVTSGSLARRAVTSGSLARGAVTTGSIAPGAITGADIQLSTLGRVPTAVTASQATVADSAPVARVKTVTVAATTAPGGATAATATCDPGLTVVGGGASVSSQEDEFVNDSYPSAANGWTVDVFGPDPGSEPFTVYAICVPAAATS